ncbi:hypothetical protein Tco_1004772 [Tanacetum coccineum]|uniref:Uncharacterized protein n=1 Tax=Tanacetum coccineum TaxID=301880 RepID=A0ABQ5FDV8_9ASTR
MLNTNTNLQTQTLNALHIVIIEAGGKDCPPMLAPAIERLKQGESINVQDLETNLYWEFGKFTSREGKTLESYYSRFLTLVKQSQELKTVSYHKLYDILKQHQNEVNEIRAERQARTANPLALRDDTDDEPDDQELEAHYMYMAQIQEVTPDDADNSGPIFDTEPLQKEHGDTNITTDQLDMSNNGGEADQDEDDDLARERNLLASLI